MAAFRASLRGKRGRNPLNPDAARCSFPFEHSLEFAERPVVHLTLHLVVSVIYPLADVGQSFDGDVRTIMGGGFFDVVETLRRP
jgi:hypothetical protein